MLSKHILRHHPPKTLASHSSDFGSKCVTSSIACPLCPSRFTHVYHNMKKHAKSHGLSLAEFRKRIKTDLEEKGRRRCQTGEKNKGKKGAIKDGSANGTVKKVTTRRSSSSGGPDRPYYICPSCDAGYMWRGGLRSHLRSFHKFTGEIRGDKDLAHLSNRHNKYSRCRVEGCGSTMVNTRKTLEVHLRRRHGQTLADYLEGAGRKDGSGEGDGDDDDDNDIDEEAGMRLVAAGITWLPPSLSLSLLSLSVS